MGLLVADRLVGVGPDAAALQDPGQHILGHLMLLAAALQIDGCLAHGILLDPGIH
jgi:hypothetical protein